MPQRGSGRRRARYQVGGAGCQAEDDDYGAFVADLLEPTSAEVQVCRVTRLGRAETLPVNAFHSYGRIPLGACETVADLDIIPGGNIYACCGPGLFMNEHNPLLLGNARHEDLAEVLDRARSNPFMKVINTRGPAGLLEDLDEAGGGHLVPRRATYTDICQLCLDVCNNRQAVEVLATRYGATAEGQSLNADQFYKLVKDHKRRAAAASTDPVSA